MSCLKRINPNDDVSSGASMERSMSESGPCTPCSAAEDGETRGAVLYGDGFEDRCGSCDQNHRVEFGRELQLLTDRGLCDAERFGDLPLAHAGGDHGPQREHAAQPREVFVTTDIAILGQQRHKFILSRVTTAPFRVMPLKGPRSSPVSELRMSMAESHPVRPRTR